MAKLAVFCDGTWNNRSRTRIDTSIGRIFDLVQSGAAGPEVRAHYQPGPGARDGLKGAWERLSDKYLGGILGLGLTGNIAECYAWLIETWQPGDQIYIFGFSRGAYTARSLAGLLRASGLPADPGDLGRALDWYKDPSPSTHPSDPRSHALRAEISARVHTDDAERDWRRERGLEPGEKLQIAYLGILDTVGAHKLRGLAGQFQKIPAFHGFHDHDLSSLVQAGRHALALDEARVFYRPTLWTNLDALNADAGSGQPYRQGWFPGDHGIVGGSGRERDLSNLALAWILEGAADAALRIDLSGAADLAPSAAGHLGALSNGFQSIDPSGALRLPRRQAVEEALHDVTLRRLREDPRYRPASLRSLLLDASALARLTGPQPGTRIV